MASPRAEPFGRSVDLVGRRVGRFEIKAALGAGGMGEVFLAEDTVLHRQVAVKRLSPKLRADPGAREQILKEARRASGLSSPYIASVYDVVEEGDELLLVMEYVEGESLRRKMITMSPMRLEVFLPIALQCAEALAAAHARAIIHRDIKPENVMISTAGLVKVLDFGLARQLRIVDEEAVTTTVEANTSSYAGTPGYMAPEVLREEASDARADVFSLGVVFYEMLAAEHPFRSAKAVLTTDRILHSEPKPLRKAAPSCPEELERIIGKMLAKDAGERYPTAADLVVDLRRLQRGSPRSRLGERVRAAARLVVLVIVFLVLATLFPNVHQHWREWIGRPELPETRNLAVLPFTADDQMRPYSEGLSETLTARLTHLTSRYPLQVVPVSEVVAQKVHTSDQARSSLGATLVLEGNLRRAGSVLRVNYNIVDTRSKRSLRADTLTLKMSDPFNTEDRVVESVLRSLELELSTKEKSGTRGTTVPEAYELYQRGLGYLQDYDRPDAIESAIAVFQRAAEQDPKFALAFAGLGESCWQKYKVTHDETWVGKAQQTCERAAALGNGALCLGTVYTGTGKYEQAVEQFREAVRQDPTNDAAYRGLAMAYQKLGRSEDAERTYRSAIDTRPHYWRSYNWLGSFYFAQARYKEAQEMFSQAAAMAPESAIAAYNLGGTYILMGRFADAIPVLGRSISIRPSFGAYSNLGTAYFYLGEVGQAAGAYEAALRLDDRDYLLWGNLGDAYHFANRLTQSKAAYQRAVDLATAALRVNPRDAKTIAYRCWYEAMLGNHTGARADMDRALAVDPNDSETLFTVAISAEQLGDRVTAVKLLKRATQAGFSLDVIRHHPVLDTLRASGALQSILGSVESSK